MQNKFIEIALAEKGLPNTQLDMLRPDERLYSVLMLQPGEDVDATENWVRIRDRDSANLKFRSFIDIACAQEPDLVLTPEYSCPWAILEELITTDHLPGEGKLWALGCESITSTGLAEFAVRFEEITWIYEDDFNGSLGNFLDPLCYVFRVKTADDSYRPVIVVQFKGQPMSEHSRYLERDNLITGRVRYIFRNNDNSIYLTSLICSDALDFTMSSLEQHLHIPYIVLHPQLNLNPRHTAFKLYREEAFLQNWERQEFICVNWARGFHVPNYQESTFGGSAMYTKSEKLLLSDERVNHNHRKGLYYSRYPSCYTNVYLFNYCEHAFLLRTTKPSQAAAVGPLQDRTGPEMLMVFCWDQAESIWDENDTCDDGFGELCAEAGVDVSPLSNEELDPVDKERLLVLSTGELRNPKKKGAWHDVRFLPTFSLADGEVARRLTFTHDPSYEAGLKRSEIIGRFCNLKNHILTDPGNYPATIKDLAHNYVMEYPHSVSGYNCNLADDALELTATVAYAGECFTSVVNKVYDEIDSILEEDQKRRLVVWYRADNQIKCVTREQKPRIDDVLSDSRRSITREGTR